MKKWTAFLLSLCLLLGTAACGEQKNELPAVDTAYKAETVASSPAASEPIETSEEQNENKILIAYFTWADNTTVTDEAAALQSALSHYSSIGDRGNYDEADAISSASVLAPGNTAKMAQWIHEYVGGDLFSITVTDQYPDNYDACMERAASEKAQNARPALSAQVNDFDSYDVIFLGFPNWWYTAPMALFSFLESYDFSGKTVIPFCAHGTGGLSATVRDITRDLPDSAQVLEPLGVYRAEINQAQPTVENWLMNLGFQKKEVEPEVKQTERKLKLIVDGREIVIELYDTPAANALYEMLPLELAFEDFNNIEKISYLQDALPTEGEPDGCDPDVGDFCLYAPWGNLSVFYKDFRYSNGLIKLGKIVSGEEWMEQLDKVEQVSLEAMEGV